MTHISLSTGTPPPIHQLQVNSAVLVLHTFGSEVVGEDSVDVVYRTGLWCYFEPDGDGKCIVV